MTSVADTGSPSSKPDERWKVFKRAQRLRDVQGFGIDRTAVAADARTAARDSAPTSSTWPVLPDRMAGTPLEAYGSSPRSARA